VLQSFTLADEKERFLGVGDIRLLGAERNGQDEPGEDNRGDAQGMHAKDLRSAILTERRAARRYNWIL